jgi:hypothetical protein
MSKFELVAASEDLLLDSDKVEWVDPSIASTEIDEIENKFIKNTDYIATVIRPAELYDNLNEAVQDGNYQEAIGAVGALNEGLSTYVEVESYSTIIKASGLIKKTGELDMLNIHKHRIEMESWFGEIGEKIKAFIKWCYDKIASIGTMIKGWFTGKSDEGIKEKLESLKDKRLSQYEVKGETYTYNGDKSLTSSVQLGSSAAKVAELFKRYHDYISQVNTHLNEFATDEGKLNDNVNSDSALNSFVENINKVISDKKTDEVWLGFTLKPANKEQSGEKGLFSKVIFTLRGQKVDKAGKGIEGDNPVTPGYKMDITGKDLLTAHEHFAAAEKTANEFTADLEKLMARLKVVETALGNKANSEESSAKVYKTVRVALEVSGDVIKNIGQAALRLAEAKKYWCVTVADAVASSDEKGKSQDSKKTEDK